MSDELRAERARLAAEVRALRPLETILLGCHEDHPGEGRRHADGRECPERREPLIARSAVLALLEEPAE